MLLSIFQMISMKIWKKFLMLIKFIVDLNVRKIMHVIAKCVFHLLCDMRKCLLGCVGGKLLKIARVHMCSAGYNYYTCNN